MGTIELGESTPVAATSLIGILSSPEPQTVQRLQRQFQGQPRWLIMQTGYRARDGSAYGYGTSHGGPTRKLMAVCRTAAGAKKWLLRLERWASEDAVQFSRRAMVPVYEVIGTVRGNGPAGLEPALLVGSAFYSDHGPETSLRTIVLGVRESHTALRWEARRRISGKRD
jgi:hypothetical protein